MGFVYQLGLTLLMICSGAATCRLLAKENRRDTFLLLVISDLASFALALGLVSQALYRCNLPSGRAGQSTSTLLRSNGVTHLLGPWDHEDTLHWSVLASAVLMEGVKPYSTTERSLQTKGGKRDAVASTYK
jgi:hypothetical protein